VPFLSNDHVTGGYRKIRIMQVPWQGWETRSGYQNTVGRYLVEVDEVLRENLQ
jgi:hypothetical protein